MPDNSINTFKDAFFGGTRPNRFQIVGNLPGGGLLSTFHAYAFNLPEIAIGEIPVNYRGRTVYVPGDRDYAPWNITILDDRAQEAGTIYSQLQEWQRKINDHEENVAEDGFATGGRAEWTITHLDHIADPQGDPAPLKEFKLVGCWLSGIGPVQLNAAEKNALLTFNATVRYDYVDYIEPTSSTTGGSIGSEII